MISTSVYAQVPIEEDESSAASTEKISVSGLSLEERVKQLERQMRNQVDLLKQINALSQQVKDLQGQLEVQSHDLALLKNQQKSQYGDIDQRLNELSHAKANPAEVAATKQPKSIAANETKKTAPATSADKDKAQKAYQAAYTLLKNKDYENAQTAFQKFIQTYPHAHDAMNAHYWLGFIYLLKNQPDKAITEFKTVVKMDAEHLKTEEALRKIELARHMQNDSKQGHAKK